MSKKAFCVGINDYPYPGYDLYGCVNDANAWAHLLIDHYDFPRSNVNIITDSQATKQNIVNGLKDLLKGAAAYNKTLAGSVRAYLERVLKNLPAE